MPHVRSFAPVLLAASVVLGACGASGDDVAAPPPTSTTTSPATSTGTASGPTTKVSANTASTDELIAALTAAGVEYPDAWADEIIEYRPYDPADPDLPKLREELGKYDPPEGLVDQIVSALTP